MSDEFNMSMRRFLKQVGITSQQAIEEAVRGSQGKGEVEARVVLSIEALGLTHEVTGKIKTPN